MQGGGVQGELSVLMKGTIILSVVSFSSAVVIRWLAA